MTSRFRRLCPAGVTALAIATAAGCGGQSAGETRAEVRRWASAVDAVCRSTRERIAARGGAHDASDLEDVAARGSEDVRAAIARTRAVDAETNLSEALGSYEQFLELYIYTLRGGNRVLTEAGGRRFRREAVRHAREVRRAFADLRGAIGAGPLPAPGAEPPAEPDSSPA